MASGVAGTVLPNILYLHSHDTGRYVQPYGYPVQTPYVQRLAEEGVLFRNAFSAAPTCSPSRAALLTGQSPHSGGMLGLAHRGFALRDPGQHLANVLKRHGYATALVGMQHVTSGDPRGLGYDDVRSVDERSVDPVAPRAADWLDSRGARGGVAPFFLDVGFEETHRPFPPGDAAEARYLRPPAPVPDTAETRLDVAGFHASVSELDRGIGIVLAALDRNNLAGTTIVVCTTDHGLAFPGMKGTVGVHGTGVTLIVRGPGGFAGGRVIDALVSHVDVFPTLCDLIGISPPAWLQGNSLLSLVSGSPDEPSPRAEINDAVFTEVTYHVAYEPQRAVRTPRWLYVRRFGDRPIPVVANCDESPSRDVWLAAGWADRPQPSEALYDTILDPVERTNLASDPAHAGILMDLRDRLSTWMAATNDPLLAGAVPLPPGAVANSPDALTPDEPVFSG